MSMLSVFVLFIYLVLLLLLYPLSFSVQASSIKEYFVCLDPSWKSMTLRTHLKEVEDVGLTIFPTYYYLPL